VRVTLMISDLGTTYSEMTLLIQKTFNAL